VSAPVQGVVVVGAGLAGTLAAVRLARQLGARISIKVIEAPGPDGGVDALDRFAASSLPQLVSVHGELGFDERAFMRATQATFSLGIEYRGFGQPGGSYLLPFGEIGARFEAVAFHHHVHRLESQQGALDLDDYSIPAIAAKAGKFAHPAHDLRSVLATYQYGYHFDATTYTRLLRALAERVGVEFIPGAVSEVLRREDGGIAAVRVAGREPVAGDLFLDCTGPRAELLRALAVGFVSWKDYLPCDRAWSASVAPTAEDGAACTRAIAGVAGWRWRAPLRARTETAGIFASAFTSAESERAALPAEAKAELLSFENGHRAAFWRANCVALGGAAGFIEPLASTSLDLTLSGIERLVSLFPERDCDARLVAEYNRVMTGEYESARDFVLLRYHASVHDGALWRHCREHGIPESLAHRLRLFRHRGRVVLFDEEIFDEAEWAASYIGQGVRASRHAVVADQGELAPLAAQVAKVRAVMHDAVRGLASHRDYLEKFLDGRI
jgi:tryptophan 7-halogenase